MNLEVTSSLKILVVEDDDDLRQLVASEITAMSLSTISFSSASEVLRRFNQFSKIVLVTDYDFNESITGSVLVECLIHIGAPLHGVILMSGHPNIEQKVNSARTLCHSKNIIFSVLEKPFGKGIVRSHLGEIVKDFSSKYPLESISNDTSMGHLNSNFMGEVLRNARSTIGISVDELISCLEEVNSKITADDYLKFEKSRSAAENMRSSDWVVLCKVLEIPSKSNLEGYIYKQHLRRLKVAMQLKESHLPLTEHLKFQLGLLDQAQCYGLEVNTKI